MFPQCQNVFASCYYQDLDSTGVHVDDFATCNTILRAGKRWCPRKALSSYSINPVVSHTSAATKIFLSPSVLNVDVQNQILSSRPYCDVQQMNLILMMEGKGGLKQALSPSNAMTCCDANCARPLLQEHLASTWKNVSRHYNDSKLITITFKKVGVVQNGTIFVQA